jgi:hypothetical protein
LDHLFRFLVTEGKFVESLNGILKVNIFFHYRIFKLISIVVPFIFGQFLLCFVIFSRNSCNVDLNI